MWNIAGPHQIQHYSCTFELDLVSSPPLAPSQMIATWRVHAVRCYVPSALLGNCCSPLGSWIIWSLLKEGMADSRKRCYPVLVGWRHLKPAVTNLETLNFQNTWIWTTAKVSPCCKTQGYVGDCQTAWSRAHWKLWWVWLPPGLESSLR